MNEYEALMLCNRWGIHGFSLPGRATFQPGNSGYVTFGAPRPHQVSELNCLLLRRLYGFSCGVFFFDAMVHYEYRALVVSSAVRLVVPNLLALEIERTTPVQGTPQTTTTKLLKTTTGLIGRLLVRETLPGSSRIEQIGGPATRGQEHHDSSADFTVASEG